ncbi:MAG TPA: efflux RND transporter periplasmic adaptor subunit [bacterium]|nr:efflux RND transporter periplasmic adaptor subunit [bacterium]HPN44980.1 efflux RND transporter periplasmic adaptor subunit [bacterium]
MKKGKSKKRIFWIAGVIVVVLLVGAVAMSKGKKKDTGQKTVQVAKADIIDKALAVGSIEPINEIAVKSKVSGVVGKMYVEVGDFVNKGDILLEVNPDPTPLELASAKRNVERVTIELETLKRELSRKKELLDKGLLSDQEYENLKQQFEQAELSKKVAQESLDLIEKGKVRIADTNIETVVKAPITGFILEKNVNLGDPVVPLTSYQAGTELMKMANMENLIFKGTVDEIDVGKIKEGMAADLQVGALPGKKVSGSVYLISLKARKQDNTTVFPVEILIDQTDGAVLRAGFSANANIIIAKKDSVLSIPERVVTFRNDSAFVMLPAPEGSEAKEQYIQTGLSDAVTIEITSGLEEGQEVLEKKPKEII